MSGKCIVSFIIGGVIGAVGAGYFVGKKVKDQYEAEANEEVRKAYDTGFNAGYNKQLCESEKYVSEDSAPEEEEEDYSEMTVYSGIAKSNGYTDYTNVSENKNDIFPEIIAPDQYGEDDTYDQISLTYYADGVVADDNDEAMSDREVDEAIGLEALETFGQFEDDAVHVVNDERKAYYEILRDERCYEDVIAEKPYLNDFNES